jgi:hypothetical protein
MFYTPGIDPNTKTRKVTETRAKQVSPVTEKTVDEENLRAAFVTAISMRAKLPRLEHRLRHESKGYPNDT